MVLIEYITEAMQTLSLGTDRLVVKRKFRTLQQQKRKQFQIFTSDSKLKN